MPRKPDGENAGVVQANTYATFEEWASAFSDRMRVHYSKYNYELPRVRVLRGFTSKGKRGRVKGETWAAKVSDDKIYEIFLQPDIDDPATVAGVIVHEHIRALLPADAGLGKVFERAALTIGMDTAQGLRHCRPGKVLMDEVVLPLLEQLGPLPHKKLNFGNYNPDGSEWVPLDKASEPQPTRMRKCYCPADGCSYKVRMTHLHIENESYGPPECPKHKVQMRVEPEKGKDGKVKEPEMPLLKLMEPEEKEAAD